MTIEDRIRQQMQRLITDGSALAGGVFDEAHRSAGVGWLASADHCVSMVCAKPTDPYRRSTAAILSSEEATNYAVNNCVGQLTELLKRLVVDVENGLVASVVSAAQAEALDDLLDQAADYHRRQHMEGAGILATAVFEDTVRRVARASRRARGEGPPGHCDNDT